MRNVLKKISILSLWLACLILFAHQLIPHDHHSDNSFSGDKVECLSHQSNQESHNHTGFPLHCHALNDLTFEKRLIVMPFCNELQLFYLLAFHDDRLKDIEETFTSSQIVKLKEPLLFSGYYTCLSLRAPPVVA